MIDSQNAGCRVHNINKVIYVICYNSIHNKKGGIISPRLPIGILITVIKLKYLHRNYSKIEHLFLLSYFTTTKEEKSRYFDYIDEKQVPHTTDSHPINPFSVIVTAISISTSTFPVWYDLLF